MWGRVGIFRETIVCDEILDPLECLLGPNIEFMLNRHNHIYLRDRDSTASLDLHRDCNQWSRPLLSVLLYLGAVPKSAIFRGRTIRSYA